MSFLVVLRNLRQRWFGGKASGGRRRARAGRLPRRAWLSTRPGMEVLEDRTVPSVLPAPVVTDQSLITAAPNTTAGTHSSPQVAVDPNNPNDLVAVWTTNIGNSRSVVQGAFSTNAGGTWSHFDISGPNPNFFLPDPTTNNPQIPFQMATNATISFDRDVAVTSNGTVAGNFENFYVSFVEHRADNAAGAVILQKYDFHTGFPHQVTLSNYPDGVLYQWASDANGAAGADPALNPVVIADSNLPPVLPNPSGSGPKVSFIDPVTHATQTDNFIVPLVNARTGVTQKDANGNVIYQGQVYVAWNTNNVAPTLPGFVNPIFNPNVIKVMGSSDGGQTFTTPRFLNNTGTASSPSDPNSSAVGERDAAPQLVIPQGTSSDRPTTTVNQQSVAAVLGGQLNAVWDDYGRGQILSNQVQDGGTGALFTDNNFTPIKDATAGANGAPDIGNPTNSAQTVAINDTNFTTLSDLSVTLSLQHANDSELQVTLLPEAQLSHAIDVAYNPADGNIYVSSENNSSVVEYSGTTGALLGVFVQPNSGGLVSPVGLVWGPDGDLYVSSSATGQVMRYDSKGKPAPAPGQSGAIFTSGDAGLLKTPTGVTFDTSGNLYVSSSGNNEVLKYQGPLLPNGSANPQAGVFVGAFVSAANNGGLSNPQGLVFGPDNNLYVASRNSSQVMRYAGPGAVGAIPGSPLPAAGQNGAVYASGNGLTSPFGVTFGADHNLYVSDGTTELNSAVLRFSGPNQPDPSNPTAPHLDADTTPGQFLGNFVSPNTTGLSGGGGLVFVQNAAGSVKRSNGNPLLDGDLFVVDQDSGMQPQTGRVLRFSPVPGDPQPGAGLTGATYVPTGANGGNLTSPQTLLFRDASNSVGDNDFLVVDHNTNSVQRYDIQTGTFQDTYIGPAGPGRPGNNASVSGPSGLALYPLGGSNSALAGLVFVASENNGLILEYKDGVNPTDPAVLVGTFAANLDHPTGLMWDPAGNTLYVSQFGSAGNNDSEIVAFDNKGNRLDGAGQPKGSGVFASDPQLQGPTGLALDPGGNLLVSSSLNSEILSFNGQTGGTSGTVVTSATVNPSPLKTPEDLFVDVNTTSLYVSSAGSNQVLRFNLNTHAYLESIVPAGNDPSNAAGLAAPYGLAIHGGTDFVTLADGTQQAQSYIDVFVTSTSGGQGSVLRYTALPAQDRPSEGNPGADFVSLGGGGFKITLVESHIDGFGNSRGTNVGVAGANMGILNGIAVGTTFNDQAARPINDPGAAAPFTETFRPEGVIEGGAGLDTLLKQNASQLNGVWTLQVTDVRHDSNPPPQFIQSWSLNFTSKLDAQTQRRVTSPQAAAPVAGNATEAGSTISVGGAAVSALPDQALVSPDRGVGPTPVIAVDNTLGSFSPYQGRLYIAYTGGSGNNTDIYLATSDDGGNTWLRTPVRVNDDSAADDFSEGNRAQFDPSVAVDQSTGTLVLSFYDARNDAANARVATYLATSLDGGWTMSGGNVVPDFAPETYVNASRTATDDISKQTVILEPIPSNESAGDPSRDTVFNYGDHQGLAVFDGHVYPVWAGNQNAGGLAIATASVHIAAGPRVFGSTQGSVGKFDYTDATGTEHPGLAVTTDEATPRTLTYDDQFVTDPNSAQDGTQEVNGFLVTFDRPVAADSFTANDVTIQYEDPNGNTTTFTNSSTFPITITPVDGYTTRFGAAQVGGTHSVNGATMPFLSTIFLVTFPPQSGVGTYSYEIAPNVTDRVRTPVTTFGTSSDNVFNSPPSQSNLRVPPQDTGGDGPAGPPKSPEGPPPDYGFDPRDTTFSTITIPSTFTSGQFITHVAVTVDIQHTNDADLIIDLIAPDGTLIPLAVNRPQPDFGNDQGFIGTTFDDNAATPISAGADPFPGSYKPEWPLAQLNGKSVNPNDVWTLAIDDTQQGGTGTLINWSLDLMTATTSTSVQAGNPMDQNGNGVAGEQPTPATSTSGGSLGDAYAVPTPDTTTLPAVAQGNAPLTSVPQGNAPFTSPFDPNTLPLIVPGPHIVQTFVPGPNGQAVDSNGSPINPPTPDNLVLNNTVNAIDVVFDRDMNASTVENPQALLRLLGPYGNIPLTTTDSQGHITGFAPGVTITPDPNSGYPRMINGQSNYTASDPNTTNARTYRITLPDRPGTPSGKGSGQDLSGTYTLSLAPVMQSANGDLLDTNQNAGLDQLRTTPSNPSSSSFQNVTNSYNATTNPKDVPVTISGGKTVDIPIAVPEQFVVQHVQVQLNINYPNDPDLEAVLISPKGTRVQLFTNVGNSGNKMNFSGTILDDNATGLNGQENPIQFGTPPFSGTYNPQQQLSTFNGEGSNGVWTLEIKDDGSSTGQLTSWSLTLQEALPGTGLGEPVADQATAHFRIFTQDPQNALSHDVWTAVGPAAIGASQPGGNGRNSGQIGALAFDPSDPTGNTAYVAGASGGVWKTTNFLTTDPSGPTYVPLTDFGPTFGINIGSIAVFGRNNDANQSIIIAATGDPDTGDSGVGFLRSMDGGATWTLLDSSTNVYTRTTLTQAINQAQTTITVASAAGFPTQGQYVIGIDGEQMLVTGGQGTTTWTVTRGYNGTTATAHNQGATVVPLDKQGHDLTGQALPINNGRDHAFVGDVSFKVVVDPTHAPTGPNDVIIYAALGGPNGGLWRSKDSGNHWQLMSSSSAVGTTATDVTLAAGSMDPNTGNLQVVYAAFEGHGVYMSSQQGAALRQMTGGQNDQLILDFDTPGNPPTTVVTPAGDTPNGAKGRIVLAAPPLISPHINPSTHQPQFALDLNDPTNIAYSQWLYAAVVAANGTLDGLYLTKDDGANWTLVQLPEEVTPQGVRTGIPTNNESDPSHDPLGGAGNSDISLAIDPNNPNVVYLGGNDALALQPAGGLIRIDTTGIEDAHNLTAADNDNPDGGLLQVNTQGAITTKNPGAPSGHLYGVVKQTFGSNGVSVSRTPPSANTPTLNLILDPFNPFLADNAIYVTGVASFNNDGQDAHYMPFDGANGTNGQHRVMAIKDPLTGNTRLVFGDDQGVFSVVADGRGNILTSVGNEALPDTSRNGNLQITQFYYGAVQPSILAAEIAGAKQDAGGLLYGNSLHNGFPVSDPHLLTDGNLSWQGPEFGTGSGIVTDQTGSGTAYSYQWPADDLFGPQQFFIVNPNGQGYVGRPGTGGQNLNPNDRSQWPLSATSYGPDLPQSNPAVNPIDANQIMISSATGQIYLSPGTQGATWTPLAATDGSYAPALAFGPVDPADPNAPSTHDDFLYAGTAQGNLFVSLDGGADWTQLNGTGNLDGSAVVSVSPDPVSGTHDAYVTTLKGVYHVSFSATYPTGAPPVVSNVAWTNNTGSGAGNLFNLKATFSSAVNGLEPQLTHDSSVSTFAPEETLLSYLSTMAVDWRYQIPNASGGGTHPALYVGGNAGVYRSLDNGQTWQIFPAVANPPVSTGGGTNGTPVDGGFLPMVHVTHLDLAVGNIVDPSSGRRDQSAGPNELVATTFGRGEFAIRLDNYSPFNPVVGPRVVEFTPVPDSSVPGGVKGVTVTFGIKNADGSITPTSVDPTTFTKADITAFQDPNGNDIRGDIAGVQDVTTGSPNPHNVYLVSFNKTETTPGTYHMTLGPQIYDFAGHAMDQDNAGGGDSDGDGPGAADSEDAFNGTFTVSTAPSTNLFVTSAVADNLTIPPGMSSITVTFNPSSAGTTTFQATLTGPNGNIPVTVNDTNPGTDTVWTVSFQTQTTPGNYTLAVPQTVVDKNGNGIDQDNDGAPYMDGNDGFSQTFTLSAQNNNNNNNNNPPPLTGPIPPSVLNVLVGPIVPLRDRHGHKVPGKFTQLVQVFNIGNQPIQAPIALVIDGLNTPTRHHHARVRLLNPLGFTAIGSPFQLAFTGLDPFSPAGAVFMMQYSAPSAGSIHPFFRVVSGIPLF